MKNPRSATRFALSAYTAFLLLLVTAAGRAQNYEQQPNDPQAYGDYGNAAPPQGDPSARIARLALLDGDVSVEPASVDQFAPAELNLPLTTGDRVYTGPNARAELEAGQMAARLGSVTDFTVTAMTDQLAQFGMANGSVHLRTWALDPDTTTELDTPNAAISVLQPGDVRVDVDGNQDITYVTVLRGVVQVNSGDFAQQLGPGNTLRLSGAQPVNAEYLRRAQPDSLDAFSSNQDALYTSAFATENAYLDPDTVGGADLGNYGTWSDDGDFGPVWYPTNVAADWAPYRVGHWAWIAPWGWTWVEAEPWGFAPFHYGRWAVVRGRWGWVPGPRGFHPVYAPALVAFVGTPGISVTAWFPLGPHEPYAPWYHGSPLYANRVNVTNIYVRNVTEVRNNYYNRSVNVYGAVPVNNGYINRDRALTAMPRESFAAGSRVNFGRDGGALRASVGNAPVLPHPLVSPTRSMVLPAPARVAPPQMARPALTRTQPVFTRPAAQPMNGQPGRTFGSQPERTGQPQQPGYNNQQPGNQRQAGGYNGGGSRNGESPAVAGQAPAGSVSAGPVSAGSAGARQVTPQPTNIPVRRGPDGGIQPSIFQQVEREGNGGPQQQQGNGRGNGNAQQPATPAQAPPNVQTSPMRTGPAPITVPGGVQGAYPGRRGQVPMAQSTQPAAAAQPAQPARSAQPAAPSAPGQQNAFPGNQQGYQQGSQQRNGYGRPLVNEAVPPAPRPSFEQQRNAMERTDPGRPLAPQQLENLRQNRPAGQPQQQEAIPHPAAPAARQPAARTQPAAAPAPARDNNNRQPR